MDPTKAFVTRASTTTGKDGIRTPGNAIPGVYVGPADSVGSTGIGDIPEGDAITGHGSGPIGIGTTACNPCGSTSPIGFPDT